jgi:hypothetical protein
VRPAGRQGVYRPYCRVMFLTLFTALHVVSLRRKVTFGNVGAYLFGKTTGSLNLTIWRNFLASMLPHTVCCGGTHVSEVYVTRFHCPEEQTVEPQSV